ncbi:hypothetical protein Pan161_19720 [Gimesia algae]|uniref:Uncharacterized protein n=1 Tax=Gimesia algae TaxID=2527971 RepID=A0A517VBE1_9PLAN|nr:hypothetical protein Pan161_19720 [Gimesia algae]
MSGFWGIGFVFLFEGYLKEWSVGSKENFRILWRCLLIQVRCWCEQWRFRCERPRSAATRRHTFGTGAVLRTAYLEKTGCFTVKIRNKWPVFRCTVNWARARHRSTLIAGGAQRSSSFYAAGVRKCVATDVENSVLQANGGVGGDELLTVVF